MRKILFKGKSVKHKEWVEGHLTTWENRNGTIDYQIKIGHENCGVTVTVIPETVGQYIGREDKNGKMIFEGDKVLTDEFGWVGEVIFDGGTFYCVDEHGGYSVHCNWEEYEIIGNIHTGENKHEGGIK